MVIGGNGKNEQVTLYYPYGGIIGVIDNNCYTTGNLSSYCRSHIGAPTRIKY